MYETTLQLNKASYYVFTLWTKESDVLVWWLWISTSNRYIR